MPATAGGTGHPPGHAQSGTPVQDQTAQTKASPTGAPTGTPQGIAIGHLQATTPTQPGPDGIAQAAVLGSFGTASPASAGSSLPVPAGTAAAVSTGPAAPPEVQQLAPALVSLATGADGAGTLTVSLHPRDLGQVEVRMVRSQDGSTSLTVIADNAQTLSQLAQNAHHLHQVLDAASVPTDHRTLVFTLSAASESGLASGGRDAQQSGAGGRDSQRQPATDDRSSGYQVPAAASGSDGLAPKPASARLWMPSGLNITA